MHKSRFVLWVVVGLVCALPSFAGIFGTVRGIVHDPQHRPIPGARVALRAKASEWTKEVETNADGEFTIQAVPVGEYTLRVEHSGFRQVEQTIQVTSSSAPILHIALELGVMEQKVEVSASTEVVNPESMTTQSLVSGSEIEQTPGAARTNSLAMITDYVPGAYKVHDQLHVRGGHQITWLVDGVPVPNTNIADTVGPQFDPRDIATLEVQRGGYSAEYGDRTYGVFNVITRSGFERNRESELILNYGSFNETNSQLSFGDHTSRFAYYASLSGNRTDLGLQTPVPEELHDRSTGLGGFVSLIFNATPQNQLRLVTSLRNDYFQVPNTPDDQAAGIRDVQRERDGFLNFSWVHTAGTEVLLTVSPFYHYNRAQFDGGPNDTSLTTDYRTSQYAGAQATLAVVRGRHNARFGIYAFYQHDDYLFGLSDMSTESVIRQQQRPTGNLEAGFLEDQFKVSSWLTLNGGIRLTHFSGELSENAADSRVGAAVRIPRLNWVLRGFYGRYYQAPPLITAGSQLLEGAPDQGFLPLHGERDEQYEVGLVIPLYGWVIDSDLFRVHAHNFFDHDPLGNSNIFLPLTIDRARIRGGEVTVRSPRLWHGARFHLAYSHQFVQGSGGVTGGITEFSPPEEGLFFLDHDQRDTLSLGWNIALPWRTWFSNSINYGSGFLDGDGPAHLPSHTTYSLALGKYFGENWTVSFTALNLTNNHFLLDNSNTFGGTHFNYPRQFAGEVRYRFRF